MNTLRTLVIGWTCTLMNWNSDLFAPKDVHGPIEWRDNVRWWIDGWLGELFAWAYHGSHRNSVSRAINQGEFPRVQTLIKNRLAL